MTLSVLDGPDSIHTYMGQGCAKLDGDNFVVSGTEGGAAFATKNAVVIDTTGGNLTIGIDNPWTPTGTESKAPSVVAISNDRVLFMQLMIIGTQYSSVGRVGLVNRSTNVVNLQSEYILEHTGETILDWQQLVVINNSTVIMWYQKLSNNGSVDYKGSYYRILTISTSVTFGAEQVFKNHTNVSGTVLDSYCGFPYAIVRQNPENDNKIYMIYQNIDTDDDGIFGINATLVGGSLVINSDVKIDTSVAPMFQNNSVESAMAALNSAFFAGGFEYFAAGGFGYSFISNSNPISAGTVYELGDRRDFLGFDRITSYKFLLVTDGISTNYARICTVDERKNISFGDELDLGTAGGACLGVWVLPDNRALIVVGTQAVIIQSDSDELNNTGEFESLGTFYHGLGELQFKTYLPFPGTQAQAMALDKPLGTVVIGSNAPDNEMAVHLQGDYTSYSETDTGIPTGTSVSAIRWI